MLKDKMVKTISRLACACTLFAAALYTEVYADNTALSQVAELMSEVTGNKITTASLSSDYPDFADRELTVESVLYMMLNKSGLKADNIGSYPDDYVSFAKDLGMIDEDCNTEEVCTADILNGMEEPYTKLYNALNREDGKKEPLFLNGMAQPIYEYTPCVENNEAVPNEKSSIIRYCVWVETDHDTDADGKLDLVRVFIQIPREAAQGQYKAGVVFEASPYSSGMIQTSSVYEHIGTEGYDTSLLYATAPPRVPSGQAADTMTAATDTSYASADTNEWYYENIYSSKDDNDYPYLNKERYNYYLVRGYAVVGCSGLGTYHSEGFNTGGADLEIDAYKCVVEWLAGKEGRIAYTDRTSNIPVYADWSNGNIAMTGRSYRGTLAFGTATTGVEGLKTIIPIAGIASWYDYTNQQGMSMYQMAYSSYISWIVTSRYLESKDWESVSEKYGRYYYQIDEDEQALHGDYGDFWVSRNYTLNKDKIKCSALIVHGLNDFNVKTKQFQLMYSAFKDSGNEVKLILHQGAHISLGEGGDNYGDDINGKEMYVNGEPYDKLVNKWLAYYLYNVDNNITDELAEVSVQDSHDQSIWSTYDSYGGSGVWTLTAPDNISEEDRYSSFLADDKLSYQTSQSGLIMANGSTYTNAAYSVENDKEITIDGIATVTFKASVSQFIKLQEETDESDASVIDSQEAAAEDDNMSITDDDMEINEDTEMLVSAMLVDVAPSGETFQAFLTDSEGEHNTTSQICSETSDDDLFYVGGGYGNYQYLKFKATDTQYKIITRGYMDLSNPTAGYKDEEAGRDTAVSIADGSEHSYTLYLDPTVYRLQEGHRLAVVLCTIDDLFDGCPDCIYTVNVDNTSVSASIPIDGSDTNTALKYLPKVNYVFDVTAGEGGRLSEDSYNPNDKKAEYGTVAKVSAEADDGYSFVGWYDDDGELFSTDTSLTIVEKDDVKLTARFEMNYSTAITAYAGNVSFTENGCELPVTVTNSLEVSQSGTIIAAFYDENGVVISTATAEAKEIKSGENNYCLSVNADVSQAAKIKAFCLGKLKQ